MKYGKIRAGYWIDTSPEEAKYYEPDEDGWRLYDGSKGRPYINGALLDRNTFVDLKSLNGMILHEGILAGRCNWGFPGYNTDGGYWRISSEQRG